MYQSTTMNEMMRLKDINVLDVRERDEFAYGHIQNAILMPLHTIPDHLQELNKQTTYYVVCHSGSRSSIACQYLSQQGYKTVNVLGGMSAYRGKLSYEM